MKDLNILGKFTLTVSLLAAGVAQAHTGQGADSFMTGLEHPIFGMDHLLAMFAVGIWSAMYFPSKDVKRWIAPLVFLLTLAGGAFAALQGWTLPLAENAIALSVLIFGLIIIAGKKLPVTIGWAFIAIAGYCHGWAHGAEMVGDSFVAYAFGFLLSTVVLHLAGLLAADKILSARNGLYKIAGLTVSALGIFLLLGQV